MIVLLESDNGIIREKARESLVVFGRPAVPFLIKALQNSASDQVRWESAKALGAIGDIRSLPPLVKALTDNYPDIAWLAAEGLIQFQKKAWPPLLHAVIKDEPNTDLLRQGVHHVLVNQSDYGYNDEFATLIRALEPNGSRESAILSAYEILKRMKTKHE